MAEEQDDQIEALIREIAQKHGIVVGRDDPIFVLQTINHRLMQDSAKAQRAQIEGLKEEMEALAQRWGLDAKEKSERVLNASLVAGKQAMAQLMEEGTRTSARVLVNELDDLLARLAQPLREARQLAVFNVVASCITLLAAVVALWGTLR
ncbi:conjugal transfer protein TraM [Massilia sp. TW-1]|uniref:Conjugal transfer protein TraM n=1 Tax=Telluria antibiotica TaxID=2717319 RepID=A0ABX0PHQ1_9BURK|nr:conjugal transfer protein TraM [Telluria antibiotica]